MNNEQDLKTKEPKERILESAVKLFAMRGYADVGVREIAENANVNIAMISYYFANKAGIFKEIIYRYFEEMRSILQNAKEGATNPEDVIRLLVNDTVELMKKKTFFCKVAITEMPFNFPEFADFKAEVIRMHIDYIRQILEIADLLIYEHKYQSIISPAVISLIFSHFLFGPIIKKIWDVEIDDSFYETYKQTITVLLLDGLHGLKEFIDQVNLKGE